MKIALYFSFLCAFLFSSQSFAKNCEEVRMGFDIGSGSTKMMVAKVDVCKKKILEVLHKDSKAVAYNEDLDKNQTGLISKEIVTEGEKALSEMLAKGKTFKPNKSYAVATSVFRKSKNGIDVIKGFAKKFKMKIEIISQEDEAELGYLSAIALLNEKELDPSKVVVWDIGGGSMQMYAQNPGKKAITYLGQIGSVVYKNIVIEVLQGKDLNKVTSPNPIGENDVEGVALARVYARIHVSEELKTILKDHVVIGIGGVHTQSVKNQIHPKDAKYTLDQLQSVSKSQSLKADKDLLGDYRATDVTNLLLVQGFMEELKIKEVNLVDASLLQGVVLK